MKQIKLLIIGLIALWNICGAANGKIINCYIGTWANYRPGDGKFEPKNIDPNLCTHLSYAFFGINDNTGEFTVLDPWLDLDSGLGHISKTVALKKVNPKLKVLAVVGGWNEGSAKYSRMAADPNKRKTFINSAVKFIKEHNFDGLDLDWEYPAQREGSPADKKNYVILLKELKSALKPLNKELGIAVAAGAASASKSYNIPEISKIVDFINVMTYDFAAHWDGVVGHNAPLKGQGERNVQSAMEYWLGQGAPASKLILGVAFYGRTATLANPKKFSTGSPTAGAGRKGPFTREDGYLGYNEICTMKKTKTWSYTWVSENSVPTLHKSNQFVSYDDVKSIEMKVDYANSLGLGGVMIWSIETDDFHGKCGVEYPLLKAINNKMGNAQDVGPTDGSPEEELPQDPEPSYPEEPEPFEPAQPGNAGDCSVEGVYPDPSNCSGFIHCAGGTPYYKECPAGLHFDATARTCNYPNDVDCKS